MRDVLGEGIRRGELRDQDIMVAAACAYGPALRMISLRLDGLVNSPLPPLAGEVWQAAWKSVRHEND
jgi:TetR/AcrR family transcriptional regulator, repressor of fatR-cypB operon